MLPVNEARVAYIIYGWSLRGSFIIYTTITTMGTFNEYVDKKQVVGVQKKCLFLSTLRVENVYIEVGTLRCQINE